MPGTVHIVVGEESALFPTTMPVKWLNSWADGCDLGCADDSVLCVSAINIVAIVLLFHMTKCFFILSTLGEGWSPLRIDILGLVFHSAHTLSDPQGKIVKIPFWEGDAAVVQR